MIAEQTKAAMIEDLAAFTHDPLRAVLYGFPWGEGPLEGLAGPQRPPSSAAAST